VEAIVIYGLLKWFELVVVISLLHELAHALIALLEGTFKGIFIGYIKSKIPIVGVGICVEKESVLALISPPILVPLFLIMIYYPSPMEVILGIISNTLGSLDDIKKIISGRGIAPQNLRGIRLLINKGMLVIEKI